MLGHVAEYTSRTEGLEALVAPGWLRERLSGGDAGARSVERRELSPAGWRESTHWRRDAEEVVTVVTSRPGGKLKEDATLDRTRPYI
jgi:hypothetical protein